MCLTNSWSILLCDLCTSVLNLKPLPLPDGLNQNTHECRASNDAKKKRKKYTPGDAQMLKIQLKLDRRQVASRLFILFLLN